MKKRGRTYFFDLRGDKKPNTCVRCRKKKICRYIRTASKVEGWMCSKCRKSNRRKLPIKPV